jgi:HSP20 family protein
MSKTSKNLFILVLLAAVVGEGYILYQERAELGPEYFSWLGFKEDSPRASWSPSNESTLQRAPKIRDLDDWDPFKELRSMREQMDEMFDDAFHRFSGSPNFGSLFEDIPFSPEIDLKEEDEQFVVTVDVPGAEESNIQVNLEGQTLRISGERTETTEKKDKEETFTERWQGRFERTLALPKTVDLDAFPKTEYENGVLTVTIPKKK